MMELFLLWLNHILKTLNLIELHLGSIFYTSHPFMKKLTTVKASGEKSFVNNTAIFIFEIRNYAME